MSGKTEKVLGYDITLFDKLKCVEVVMSWIKAGGRGRYFVCANPHSIELAGSDAVFDRAIRAADLIVPDGAGILLASRILGGNIRERVTGSDIFWGLNAALEKEKGYSCFFLGSTEQTLKQIEEKMGREYPHIKVAGVYSPPFREDFSVEDEELMVDAVNRAAPDVLWVGMTQPKQEKWVFKNLDRLNAGFIGPVGAVFDFFTGGVKRSHPLFQSLGLEWLPRLLQEPGRLWRRNFISSPRFVLRVLRERLALRRINQR
jgi:N-acetylglucosaminyldiphosphoundecaprenol N-acetyl-beta-D-mannosaminyltransferase